ncbi:MAG: SagB/ThcOx family dehydrogenase [Spirochaetota bacterium]|nr:MAG: SagB/ThcOx family dehydrogenase [Spirochaetota bacterium]
MIKKLLVIIFFLHTFSIAAEGKDKEIVQLPEPQYDKGLTVGEALNIRRSVRSFSSKKLVLREVSELLWASSGKTFDGTTAASRTYPSAGGLHPLNVYLVTGGVEDIKDGIYKYESKDHTITLLKEGDYRKSLAQAGLGQSFIRIAPVCIIITALYNRTGMVYGERGTVRYIHMDAGHAAQNVCLMSASLGLGTVAVGAFIDEKVKNILGLEKEVPLYLLPVGHPSGK